MNPLDNLDELLKHPRDCFISGDHPARIHPSQWCVGPIILHRDSDPLEESNARVLRRELGKKKELEEQYEFHVFNHWAVGWVEHLSFQVKTPEGEVTGVTKWLGEWFKKLEDYPIADEDDYAHE